VYCTTVCAARRKKRRKRVGRCRCRKAESSDDSFVSKHGTKEAPRCFKAMIIRLMFRIWCQRSEHFSSSSSSSILFNSLSNLHNRYSIASSTCPTNRAVENSPGLSPSPSTSSSRSSMSPSYTPSWHGCSHYVCARKLCPGGILRCKLSSHTRLS